MGIDLLMKVDGEVVSDLGRANYYEILDEPVLEMDNIQERLHIIDRECEREITSLSVDVSRAVGYTPKSKDELDAIVDFLMGSIIDFAEKVRSIGRSETLVHIMEGTEDKKISFVKE